MSMPLLKLSLPSGVSVAGARVLDPDEKARPALAESPPVPVRPMRAQEAGEVQGSRKRSRDGEEQAQPEEPAQPASARHAPVDESKSDVKAAVPYVAPHVQFITDRYRFECADGVFDLRKLAGPKLQALTAEQLLEGFSRCIGLYSIVVSDKFKGEFIRNVAVALGQLPDFVGPHKYVVPRAVSIRGKDFEGPYEGWPAHVRLDCTLAKGDLGTEIATTVFSVVQGKLVWEGVFDGGSRRCPAQAPRVVKPESKSDLNAAEQLEQDELVKIITDEYEEEGSDGALDVWSLGDKRIKACTVEQLVTAFNRCEGLYSVLVDDESSVEFIRNIAAALGQLPDFVTRKGRAVPRVVSVCGFGGKFAHEGWPSNVRLDVTGSEDDGETSVTSACRVVGGELVLEGEFSSRGGRRPPAVG